MEQRVQYLIMFYAEGECNHLGSVYNMGSLSNIDSLSHIQYKYNILKVAGFSGEIILWVCSHSKNAAWILRLNLHENLISLFLMEIHAIVFTI